MSFWSVNSVQTSLFSNKWEPNTGSWQVWSQEWQGEAVFRHRAKAEDWADALRCQCQGAKQGWNEAIGQKQGVEGGRPSLEGAPLTHWQGCNLRYFSTPQPQESGTWLRELPRRWSQIRQDVATKTLGWPPTYGPPVHGLMLCFILFFLIEVYLIYNFILVSAVQHNDLTLQHDHPALGKQETALHNTHPRHSLQLLLSDFSASRFPTQQSRETSRACVPEMTGHRSA